MRKVQSHAALKLTKVGSAAMLGALMASSAFADVITNRSYQTGFTLPGVRSPSGNDEVRAADGTTCRSSMANRGAYIDLGGVANENGGKFGDSSVYGRVIIPLGQKPDRIDCNALYQLEIERLRLEMRLLREAAERGPEAPITKDDPFGEGDEDPFSYTPEMETGVSRTVASADDPFGKDEREGGFVIPPNPGGAVVPPSVATVLPVEQTPIAPPRVDANAPTRAPLVPPQEASLVPAEPNASDAKDALPTSSETNAALASSDPDDPLGDLNPYASNYAPLSVAISTQADAARAFDPLLADRSVRSVRDGAASPRIVAVPVPIMRPASPSSARNTSANPTEVPTIVFAMTADPKVRYGDTLVSLETTASMKTTIPARPSLSELYAPAPTPNAKEAQPVLDWTPSQTLASEIGY